MSEQYLSEIRIFSFNFPPQGWAYCNGQLLSINQNQALFSLLGNRYGGNGTTHFALPNLIRRMSLHASDAYPQGQLGGEENNTLTISELPAHTHAAMASSNKPNASTPSNNFWSSSSGFRPYGSSANSTMAANAVSSAGLSQPHSNLAPYLVLNFCIAISGEFPTIN